MADMYGSASCCAPLLFAAGYQAVSDFWDTVGNGDFELKILSFDWAFVFQWIVASSVGWLLGKLVLPWLGLLAAGVFASALQTFILRERIPNPLAWVQASLVGWLASYLVVVALRLVETDPLTGIAVGAAVGLAQWLVLRRTVRWAGWWVAFSVMGWVTGLALLPGLLSTGAMTGLITGTALEILLRNKRE